MNANVGIGMFLHLRPEQPPNDKHLTIRTERNRDGITFGRLRGLLSKGAELEGGKGEGRGEFTSGFTSGGTDGI